MGSNSKPQVVGFRYSFDIHFAIGLAIDELMEIRASGKTAWKGSVTSNQTIYINAPNLFGGDKGEGGIQGNLDVMFGEEDQTVNSRLAAALGGLVPAFRGFAGGFFSGLVTSINPYPKPWKILRRRALKGWDGAPWYQEKCVISLNAGQIKAMNAVHILYETYTNRDWGRGLDRSLMDDVAFRSAADKLYSEGFGLCLEWKRSGSITDFRDQVCNHIGATVGPDRLSGLITITLIRDDYDPDSLPLFDEDSGLLSFDEDEASSSLLPPSQLIVKYVDAITGETRSARAINAAIAQSQGGPSIETIEYPGLPTGELAGRVAARDMRIKGSGLRRFKIKLDRRAYAIAPGKPFRVRSLKRGIATMVVRAGRIEDGTLSSGAITITALQDVFGLPANSYVPVPPSNWVPPDATPKAIATRRLMEVPYRELAGSVDPANLALIDVTSTWLVALGVRPSGLAQSYTVTSRPGTTGSFIERGNGTWCPSALLVVDLLPGVTAATLTAGVDLDDVTVGMAALLDEEIVRIDAINLTTGAITLGRGCADTVEVQHAAGARLWFYDGNDGEEGIEYSPGVTVQTRLLTNTSQGQLDQALAGTDSIALAGRQGRPYPPGQFKIAGASYPSSVTGDVVVTWAHRDRLNQADQLIDSTQGNIGPEVGTTYTARLRRTDTAELLAVISDISGGTTVLAAAYNGEVAVELFSVRGGLASWQMQRHVFVYTGDIPPPASDPYWSDVASLLHFDGEDGVTSIVDQKGGAWARTGSPGLTTTDKKFGSASLQCASSGQFSASLGASVPVGGSLSVEFWLKLGSSGRQVLLGNDSGSDRWWIEFNRNGGGELTFVWGSITGYGSVVLNVGQWYHVAAVRYASGYMDLFIDGVRDSQWGADTRSLGLNNVVIGAMPAYFGGAFPSTAKFDDLRITKADRRVFDGGLWRYPVPTAAHPDS